MSDLSIQVAVADDHPCGASRRGNGTERNPSLRIIGQANDSTELVALLDQHPAMQVLDYNMPGGRYGDGLVLLSHLRRRYRELRLVLYTMVDNPALLLAIVKQGTSGVVSKSDFADASGRRGACRAWRPAVLLADHQGHAAQQHDGG